MIEPWQKVWRASCDYLPLAGLEALREAILADSKELIQKSTVQPCKQIFWFPIAGACPWGYCQWKGRGLKSPGQVENAFCNICDEIADRFLDTYAYASFTHFVDSTPRAEMLAKLLPEVELAIERKQEEACQPCLTVPTA